MTTEDFLFAIFGGITEGALEIWLAAPNGVELQPRRRVLWKALPLREFTFAGSPADDFNHAGYGVSFGCAVRREKKPPEERIDPATGKTFTMKHPRGSEGDAIYLPMLWADIDNKDGTTVADIAKIAQPPSILVSSGGGWHCYWLLDTPEPITDENRPIIKRTLKGMAVKIGSDRAVAELARTMRLPGTINTKPERQGARCEVWAADVNRRYPLSSFTPYGFYAGAVEPNYSLTRRVPSSASTPLPPWVEEYLIHGSPAGERNHTLFRMACAYAEHGKSFAEAERDLGSRATSDGLEPAEIRTTLHSAYLHADGVALPPHLKMRMGSADHALKGSS